MHYDNLAALAETRPELGPLPSYRSVLRFMRARGYLKRPRRGPLRRPGAQAAEHRYQAREIRSYESEDVGALWHLDFHHGSVRVLRPCGNWAYPLLLAASRQGRAEIDEALYFETFALDPKPAKLSARRS